MKKNKKLYIGIFLLSTLVMFAPLLFKNYLVQFQSFGILGLFFLNFFSSATLFLPSPAIFSVVVGGQLYNPLLVALAAALGSSFGEGVGFLFGYSSHKTLKLNNHKVLYHLIEFTFQKYGVVLVFLFSLIPNPLFDGIGIFAGVSSMSAKRFLLVVFLGRLLRNLAIVYFGQLPFFTGK